MASVAPHSQQSTSRTDGTDSAMLTQLSENSDRVRRKEKSRRTVSANLTTPTTRKKALRQNGDPLKMLPALGYKLAHANGKGPSSGPQKSIFTTYLLWLFGGFFGVHHFYLGRDSQAFLWWCTLGGYFGCGWLRDLFVIPKYVAEANNDPKHIEKLIERIKSSPNPPFSGWRFAGMTIFGYLFAALTMYAIPEEEFWGISWKFLYFLIPVACATGVWLVGNLGTQEGSIWWALAAAFGAYPLCIYLEDETTWFSVMVVASAMAFDNMSKKWRRQPRKKRRLVTRIAILTLCAALYLGLWMSYLYFNAKMTDSNGDEIPVHEAVHHFFTSPWWVDVWQSLKDVYTFAQHHGWYETWKQVIDLSDPHGEINAHKVLNVPTTASQAEITAAYRALSREYHPDKVKDPEKRSEAQSKFMEIQQAYELLSNNKVRRKSKNRKSA